MKKAIVGILVVVLLTSGLLVGCAGVLVGSGKLKTEKHAFTDFNKVEVHYGFQVELIKSNTFSIEITADGNVHDSIKVDKTGDSLKIGFQVFPPRNYVSCTKIAKITMPDLYKLDLSGGSRASITGFSSSNNFAAGLSGGSRIEGDITAADADFNLSGGSQIVLSGSADDLDVDGSGGSQLALESFPVNNADINLSGGGRATINVIGTLDVNLSGGSKVIHIGEPTLDDVDLSGGSMVSKK